MNEEQQPYGRPAPTPPTPTPTPIPTPAPAPAPPPPLRLPGEGSRRGADWMFGGVYGTVLASALLAALHQKGEAFTPYYDASWVLVTAATAGLAHGYSHHMAAHLRDSAVQRWRLLGVALWNEWPLIVAALAIGMADATIGLAIIVANAVIK